jgi:hypothetical protein
MRTLQAGKADHFFKDAAFALNGINQPAARSAAGDAYKSYC